MWVTVEDRCFASPRPIKSLERDKLIYEVLDVYYIVSLEKKDFFTLTISLNFKLARKCATASPAS